MKKIQVGRNDFYDSFYILNLENQEHNLFDNKIIYNYFIRFYKKRNYEIEVLNI